MAHYENRLKLTFRPLDTGWEVEALDTVTYDITRHAISSLQEASCIFNRHVMALEIRRAEESRRAQEAAE